MELRVKQRLVGASILGVLVVLIVPELLSGPAPLPTPKAAAGAPEPVRNVTVDLATAKAPVADPVPEPAPAPSAPPSSAQPASAQPATVPPPTALPPGAYSGETASAVARARLETSAPPPTYSTAAVKQVNAGRGWAVQLGSFASHDNADKLQRQLKAQGFSALVSPSGTGASLRYRVRIGPLADRGAAALVVEKLKSSGHASSLVPPGP
jgi:DedD protein